VQNYSVMHWSALLQRGTEVLNVAGRLAPTQVCGLPSSSSALCQRHNFSSFSFFLSSLLIVQTLPAVQNVKGARPLSRVQISTMAVKDNLIVAGGFQGELICKVGLGGLQCRLVSVFSLVLSAYRSLTPAHYSFISMLINPGWHSART